MWNIAVIDCGSNSFHLVIATILKGNEFEIIERKREVLRIGFNPSGQRVIPPGLIEKAGKILKRFNSIAKKYDAEIIAVATSAIREAENRGEFLQKVKKKSGINIGIIDGIEEARLIFLGIRKAIKTKSGKILCIDIGGGSTEFIIGHDNKILYSASIKIGAVRLTQKYFIDSILSGSKIKLCTDFIRDQLMQVIKEIQNIGFGKCVGTSGTILASASMIFAGREIKNKKTNIMNGFSFSITEFEKIKREVLNKTSVEERKKIPGLDEGRADIIPAGILILSSILESLSINEVAVSQFAIREGLIFDYMM